MRPLVFLLAAMTCGSSCGSSSAGDAGVDGGQIGEYFGIVHYRCFEYVIGTQPKAIFDLGVVDFQTDTTGTACPQLPAGDGGTPAVHIVRYYSGTPLMMDYLYFAGGELRRCRRDYYSATGNSYFYRGTGLTVARQPAVGNDRIVTTSVTDVRDSMNRAVYTAPQTLSIDTLVSSGLATAYSGDGGIDTVRFIYEETIEDGGVGDGSVAGSTVSSETRYVAPGLGWAGLDIAVDSPQGAILQYRLQGVRTIHSDTEALQYPCGAEVPDGG